MIIIILVQRPNAKELLRHRLIRNARKTSGLTDLIDRYKKWKASGDHSDSDSEDTSHSKSVFSNCAIGLNISVCALLVMFFFECFIEK